uniref:Uncharacterized protein n=1 Tax=Oryza punctata TaxID=4537 RepID=A0A0E0LTH9_ORYPU
MTDNNKAGSSGWRRDSWDWFGDFGWRHPHVSVTQERKGSCCSSAQHHGTMGTARMTTARQRSPVMAHGGCGKRLRRQEEVRRTRWRGTELRDGEDGASMTGQRRQELRREEMAVRGWRARPRDSPAAAAAQEGGGDDGSAASDSGTKQQQRRRLPTLEIDQRGIGNFNGSGTTHHIGRLWNKQRGGVQSLPTGVLVAAQHAWVTGDPSLDEAGEATTEIAPVSRRLRRRGRGDARESDAMMAVITTGEATALGLERERGWVDRALSQGG